MVTGTFIPALILIGAVTFSKAQSGKKGISDDELLSSVPNVPKTGPWLDPFAIVDVKDQKNLDWGPVPKPIDTGPGTSNSKTDVTHAVEDLMGNLNGVEQNTHDANEAHFIDFWLSGGELPPSISAHINDAIGNSLAPQGLPDIVGTDLTNTNENLTFQPVSNNQGESVSANTGSQSIPVHTSDQNQGDSTTTEQIPTTFKESTTESTTFIPVTTTLKIFTTPTTIQTTEITTPNPTTLNDFIVESTTTMSVLPPSITTPKLSKQLLRKLQKERQREIARQKAKALAEARKLAKAKKAEETRIAREKAKQERLARLKAKQEKKRLEKLRRQEAQRLAREKIKARKLALIAARKKARVELAKARRLSRFEARLKAMRERKLARQRARELKRKQKANRQNSRTQASRNNPRTNNNKNLSPEEMRKLQNAFLQSLLQ